MVSDGCGHRYEVELVSVSKKQAQGVIVQTESFPKSTVQRAVALGSLHKKDRIELAVEKAVELGVIIFICIKQTILSVLDGKNHD